MAPICSCQLGKSWDLVFGWAQLPGYPGISTKWRCPPEKELLLDLQGGGSRHQNLDRDLWNHTFSLLLLCNHHHLLLCNHHHLLLLLLLFLLLLLHLLLHLLLLLCNQRKLCSPMWARRRGMEIYSASFSLLIGITWKGKSFKASTVVIYEDGEISVSNKPFSLIQSQYIVVVEVTTNYNNARCVWQKKEKWDKD